MVARNTVVARLIEKVQDANALLHREFGEHDAVELAKYMDERRQRARDTIKRLTIENEESRRRIRCWRHEAWTWREAFRLEGKKTIDVSDALTTLCDERDAYHDDVERYKRTNTRLNRRAQAAEAAARANIEKIKREGNSLGRALARHGYELEKARADELEETNAQQAAVIAQLRLIIFGAALGKRQLPTTAAQLDGEVHRMIEEEPERLKRIALRTEEGKP